MLNSLNKTCLKDFRLSGSLFADYVFLVSQDKEAANQIKKAIITVLIPVKTKAITARPFFSLLYVKVIKEKTMKAMAVMMRNPIINKPTRSEVAIARDPEETLQAKSAI